MFEWIRKTAAHRRNLREITALDDRDLADIGLGREALQQLVAVDAAIYDRMDRKAALHGVSHADLQDDRPEFAALVHICESCASSDRCQEALAKPGIRADETGFCPNHAAYVAIAEG